MRRLLQSPPVQAKVATMGGHPVAVICDLAALLVIAASLSGHLPEIAAGMAVIYYLFLFFRWSYRLGKWFFTR